MILSEPACAKSYGGRAGITSLAKVPKIANLWIMYYIITYWFMPLFRRFNKFFALAILIMSCDAAERERPNIVVFMIDDMGYSDVGCYGSEYYETPHIDRLAQEGMRFTNAYAASMVCSPTRASFLTGKYPGRLHITHAIPIEGHQRLKNTMLMDASYVKNLPLEEVTIAEALEPYGYTSAAIGKWHVSWEEGFYPEQQGFDVNIGGNNMGNPGNYFCPYDGKWRMTADHPYVEWNVLPQCEDGEYLTDRLTIEAGNFIDQNKDRPFFVYMQHYAVHTPIQAKEDLIGKYEKKTGDTIRGHTNPKYAAMIESVDESVGRILKKLKDLGLNENTIIVFTSDNGGHGKITSNWPFRGNKGNFYEGGIRVPLIVKWPDQVKANSENDTPVITPDLYPTLLSLAGLPLKPEQHLDGIDLSPLLTDNAPVDRGESLYWHFPNYTGGGHPNGVGPCSVIRDHDWKLIEHLEDGRAELFNLKEDALETRDLAAELPGKVDELKQKLNNWRVRVNAQSPRPNPAYNAALSVRR